MPRVTSNLRVKVIFFGRIRELVGRSEEFEEVPEGATLADLFDRYAAKYPRLAGFRGSLVASRNQEFAPWSAVIEPGDEVAFLPPVSGG